MTTHPHPTLPKPIVPDPRYFGTDPEEDPNARIRTSD